MSQGLSNYIAWVAAVTRISALKYSLLGDLTPRGAQDALMGSSPVMLTVIAKHARPDIPALLLLGRRAGDLLPQHVVPVLREGQGLIFEPYFLVVNNYAPVLAHLQIGIQPFCFSALDANATLRALMQLDLFDGG